MIFFLYFCNIVSLAKAAVSPSGAVSYGLWKGWGSSLAWWGNVFGDRDDIFDLFYTMDMTDILELREAGGAQLPGLGMTIARYNIGACSYNTAPDGSKIVFSPNIPEWKQIHGFWLDWTSSDTSSSSWDWSVDTTQILALQKTVARGADIVEFFSNSPMWWMLVNHNPSGSENGNDDNLSSWNYEQHAVYIASVVQYFAEVHNISATSVDAFNEPVADWWKANNTQEGCHFDTSTQAAVLGYLRKELDSRGYTSVEIASSDESLVDMAVSTWNAFDDTTKRLVDIVNVHGYEGMDGDRQGLYQAVVVDGNKPLRNSEYGDGDGSGYELAMCWMLDFSHMHEESLSYWQPLDWGGWGLLDTNMDLGQINGVNRKYFVVAQFSRHIRAGSLLIDAGDEENSSVAAYDETRHTLIIVHLNQKSQSEDVSFDLSEFEVPQGQPVSRWVTDTDTSLQSPQLYARMDDAAVSHHQFSCVFNARQIQTFEINNVLRNG